MDILFSLPMIGGEAKVETENHMGCDFYQVMAEVFLIGNVKHSNIC